MLKSIIIVLFLCLFSDCLFAQTNIDWSQVKFKNDSVEATHIYRVSTLSGNVIVGELIKIKGDKLFVDAGDLGIIQVDLAKLATIQPKDKSEKPTQTRMVGGNHYLITPSTYGLEKGEVNLQNSEIFFLSAHYGITDNFTLSGGFSIIPGVPFGDQLFYLIPKFNFALAPKVRMSVQYTQIFQSDIDNTGLLSTGISYGSIEKHIMLGYTLPVFVAGEGNDITNGGLNIGGIMPIRRKVSLMLDSLFPIGENASGGLVGPGIRVKGKSSAFDFGFLIPTIGPEGFPLPWFNYTLRL